MPATEQKPFKAWSFLSRPETESGELYYADDLETQYVWDTTVANRDNVSVGDLAVVRDSDYVLGAGWIESIEKEQGPKTRYRCPYCSTTNPKPRRTKLPKYHCGECHQEFDDRVEDSITVTWYTATYSSTFQRTEPPAPIAAIRSLYLTHSHQQSIRELDADLVRPVLRKRGGVDMLWRGAGGPVNVQITGGHRTGQAKARKGQEQFRDALRTLHGDSCAFTGPQPPKALQAAHLYQYSQDPRHDVQGGLLLRSDLHSLFDDWLITVDPDTWTIHVAPELAGYPALAALEGQPLGVPEAKRPRREYIQVHAAKARSRWEQPTT